MKIGFIGVGTMGRHMAANLIKSGFLLVVNDVRKEATNPHVKDGATWADTPKAVAEASDVVFTSLPGPVEVEAVALGHTGILAGMSPGKVYFDLSTNSPTVVRRIEAVPLLQLDEQPGEQVDRLDLVQAAVLLALAARGADVVVDECVGHVSLLRSSIRGQPAGRGLAFASDRGQRCGCRR